MSFLEEVKSELVELRIKKNCCMASEVRGILTFGGVPFGDGVLFGTDSFAVAKRLSVFLRRLCSIDFTDRLSEDAESYKFVIPGDVLDNLKLSRGESINETEDIEKDYCCMRAYVRGAFLASGSASSPDKAYRVEIFSENKTATEKVAGIFEKMSLNVKTVKRKKLYVVYANNSESASDMLKVTEASGAVFKMLEAKINKERRNDTNRQFNCDMANIERASTNAARELDAIRIIEKKAGLDSLKPKLREAAMLRKENESSTIMEMCALCDPPLAKSTLKNRLNKLIEIAKELSD